jgi:TIR domain/Carboxypeptidase regulatory-like domain
MARYDVFISYSRADTERVTSLRDALRGMGYRVFFDVQSIDPGSPWKDRLRRAIGGSRTLVLCWSENTRGSEYVTFEYSQAEAFRKRIFPWRLDQTPLPAMMELQAMNQTDAPVVAALLKPALGWPLRKRRATWMAAAAVAAVLLGGAAWRMLHPPPAPPWNFAGEITERVTAMPIVGAEVDVLANGEVQASAQTDAQGRFDLRLPPPKPATITVRVRKAGFEGEPAAKVPTDQPWNIDLTKLP